MFAESVFGMWNKSLAPSVLFFTFLVHSCFLFIASLYSLTGARTHGRTHAPFIALITRKDEDTVPLSLYLGTLLSVPFSRGLWGGFSSNKIFRSNPEQCDIGVA